MSGGGSSCSGKGLDFMHRRIQIKQRYLYCEGSLKQRLNSHIIFCPFFFVPAQLMKAKVCSFHKIISKLLWQSSGNGSCSFLYQLSDLYLASLQKQSLSSQLVWSGRFWIRSVPLKGLMFPVLSHGFIHSHEGKGEPCWAALEPC